MTERGARLLTCAAQIRRLQTAPITEPRPSESEQSYCCRLQLTAQSGVASYV
jgi:hypothetical protein